LLAFIEQGNLYKNSLSKSENLYDLNVTDNGLGNYPGSVPVKTYVCPSDPGVSNGMSANSGNYGWGPWGAGCYALNWQVFGDPTTGSWQKNASIPRDFVDGTSNTIILAEKYASCGDLGNGPIGTLWGDNTMYIGSDYPYQPTSRWPPVFAVTAPGKTEFGPCTIPCMFQVQPTIAQCIDLLANTAHPGGMNVCFGDGSVRSLAGSVNPTTVWWPLLTPAGGEVLPNF
jgi:prepilin-type processing-associated H-X9-DG protein